MTVLKKKLSLVGHTMHAEVEGLKKSTMLGVREGRRGRDRLCMCCMDGVESATKLSLPEPQEVVQDRDV